MKGKFKKFHHFSLTLLRSLLKNKRRMIKNISLFIFSALLVMVVTQCANQGYPEGGPRDETPPRMINSVPSLNEKNFQGDEVVIEFNELIVLKEALQKVVISPPLNNPPTITGIGNKVTVKFDEELHPATTYTIDNADAIQDNNEANALTDFTFSFSTGETQDSLQISGHLFDAQTHTPVPGALVMAHSNHADTAFTNMVPPRVAKTNSQGAFTIRNLAEGEYRIFALEDANRNYRFDQPGERIAWHPDTVTPAFERRERVDSLFADSVTLDTVIVTQDLVYLPDSIQLFLFQEDYETQYLDTRERSDRHRLDFFINRPLERPLEVELLDVEPRQEDWFVYEHSANHDSVMIWLADSSLISRDSLTVKTVYPVRDSLKQLVEKIDTLNMFHSQSNEQTTRQKDNEEVQTTVEPLRVSVPGGNVEVGASVWLQFPTPVKDLNRQVMELAHQVDTIFQPVDFELEQDSVRIRSFRIKHSWLPEETYRFQADSAAVVDILGRVTNEIRTNFTFMPEDRYGTLYVDVSGLGEHALLQVLDSKEVILRKGVLPENGKLAFRYLKPGQYFLRIVNDINDNGRWDTGDFSDGRQPEQVLYYPDSIQLRANWDQVVPWYLNADEIYEFVKKNRIKENASP
jgi:uncharacterized protein (DUF2141 family)